MQGTLGNVATLNPQPHVAPAAPHMVVCGDDGLVHRLAAELSGVYGERVTVVLPPAREARQRPAPALGRAAALFGRVTGVVGRAGAPDRNGAAPGSGLVRVLEAAEPGEEAFTDAGVVHATALALVYDDDETNVQAALLARRLNPHVRLVIRLYNRRLGEHLAKLLDQAAQLTAAVDGTPVTDTDATTTVLSDADTAAPVLVTAAVSGHNKVIEAGGLMLRAAERSQAAAGRGQGRELCTLALLSPALQPGSAAGPDGDGPLLLPGDRRPPGTGGRAEVVLEAVPFALQPAPVRPTVRGLPLGSFFSRRLRWALGLLTAAVCALAVASWSVTSDNPTHAVYLSLLDLFAINEPAIREGHGRQVLQLLSGLTGLLLLPLLVAAALEGLGTFRSASALRRPRRGLSGHVVLLGLGKIGTRVLARLRELGIPVVCVERDPQARGVALARSLRVPTIIGDVTEEGVLDAAKVGHSGTLLALTSSDITNLEAVLYARAVNPEVRVVMRLYDDRFAKAVYRTLRASHPRAWTRSRSVSFLVAPAFAGAMIGRQILGAVPVERQVVLIAALEVEGRPELNGQPAGDAFVPGAWRALAVTTRRLEASGREETRLMQDLPGGYRLGGQDRVIVAATRQGLADLLGRRPVPRPR
ncbi:potassium transporter TrkA [Streptomyces hiroshimensis]|uniref:Potassium transporter TrkA n=2 Tax=Streptomyces hiroshimensis TaxID=66424 RepID=A0ABQ2Y3L5_9ACTN|nr:potassium transporter TrkA [Streptomyces hiroshimensis]